MQLSKLTIAIAEAERFLERAKVLHDMLRASDRRYFNEPKPQGAVRRASMDLTRALAELRKPN